MQHEDAQRLIDRHDAGWNAQDLDAIMACYTPDIVFENHNAGEAAAEGAGGARPPRRHLRRLARPALPGPPRVRRGGLRRERVDGHRHAPGRRRNWSGTASTSSRSPEG